MRWRRRNQLRLEYVGKGIFLGLAFVLIVRSGDWREALQSLAWAGAVLAAALLFIDLQSVRQRKGANRAFRARFLLALLEHPAIVHLAILSGMLLGLFRLQVDWRWILGGAGCGVAIGAVLIGVIAIPRRAWRLGVEAATVGVAAALLWAADFFGWLALPSDGWIVAAALPAAALLWYCLLLSGQAEESELEIGLLCLALSLAFVQAPLPLAVRGGAFLAPVAVFIVYVERIRRNVVAFKYALRGLSHEQHGDLRNALVGYRLALGVSPKLEMAVAGNWRVHRRIDLRELEGDADLQELIDPRACLERAKRILNQAHPVGDELVEAHQLLGLVEKRRGDLPWTLARERLRLLLAAGQGADAATYVERLLPVAPAVLAELPEYEAEAIFHIWTLALKDPALAGPTGLPLLETQNAVFAFIASLERRLAQWPDDPDARAFRPFIYDRVVLKGYRDYVEQRSVKSLSGFSYDYCRDLGLSAANAAPPDFGRAFDLLQIAEAGLPEQRVHIWRVLARIEREAGGAPGAAWLERIRDYGMDAGPANLSAAQREAFYDAVRLLGEDNRKSGDLDSAIHHYQVLADSPKAGVGTLHVLQRLYEDRGDYLQAIRPVESALVYSLGDADRRRWLDEKLRLYGLLTAETVAPHAAQVKRFFDFDFCFQQAQAAFENRSPASEIERWLALAALGGAEQQSSIDYLLGRVCLRDGRIQEAVENLEKVRVNKPSSFNSEREKRYFDACRLLADVYLEDLNEPAKAVEVLRLVERFRGSGADTLYKLGRAYEAAGQPKQAKKWYDMVLVYPNHPRAADARAALDRLRV